MSKKKLTLLNNLSGTTLAIGIATSDNEFQVSLLLNSILSIKLTLNKSIEKANNPVPAFFPCFSYITNREEQIFLIRNKNKGSLLFNNHAQFDYLIIITSPEPFNLLPHLTSELKLNNSISFVSEVAPSRLSNLKNYLK